VSHHGIRKYKEVHLEGRYIAKEKMMSYQKREGPRKST
jgi:hypothetical protein